jgi:hypothetical protein
MALVINISAVPPIYSINRIDTPGKQQAEAVGMLAKSFALIIALCRFAYGYIYFL